MVRFFCRHCNKELVVDDNWWPWQGVLFLTDPEDGYVESVYFKDRGCVDCGGSAFVPLAIPSLTRVSQ